MKKWYRVSKYDPSNRDHLGRYQGDEWTSFSDIVKNEAKYGKCIVEYYKIENSYIDTIIDMLSHNKNRFLRIRAYECYSDDVTWKNHQKLSITSVIHFARDCLREKCWGKMYGKRIEIHFGYDYYMYIGVCQRNTYVEEIVKKHNLYVECIKSPYN